MTETPSTRRLSDKALFERALSLANDACFTVALQYRRLRETEPEDNVFLFRWWADLQFLIVALRRMRRTAQLAASIPCMKLIMTDAILRFDSALPDLTKMRNVGEHIDDYAIDNPKRRHREVTRLDLQAGTWDGCTFTWLGGSMHTDSALQAAEELFATIQRSKQLLITKDARVPGRLSLNSSQRRN